MNHCKKEKIYSKLFALMPSFLRRRFYLAFSTIGIVGFLEAFSLSALLAIFSMGSSSSKTGSLMHKLELIYNKIHFSVYQMLVLIVALFILKSLLTLIVTNHLYKTSTLAKKYIQDQMFLRFLYSPFSTQSMTASAEWIRKLTVDCYTLEGRFFMPLLVLMGELIPVIFICCVLLFVNYVVFIVIASIFIIVGLALFFATHKTLIKLGKEQQQAEQLIVQSAQHVYQGLRELTIYRLQNWAKSQFLGHTEVANKTTRIALYLSALPKLVFEVAIYVSLAVMFFIYAWQQMPLKQAMAQFAVFGMAAIRLLPSISKVVSHMQSLGHAGPAVGAIVRCLEEKHPALTSEPLDQTNKMITFEFLVLENIYFSYPQQIIFQNLNLRIQKGDRIAVVGPSGSGKSTLINLILGLLPSKEGDILLNGECVTEIQTAFWSCIGYVPQEPFLIDDTVIKNVVLGADDCDIDDQYVCYLLEQLQLPESLYCTEKTIGECGANLSGGQRQRVAIARALYRKPQLLILDESTSAMDAKTQKAAIQLIKSCMKDGTLLMITHREETLIHCNKILSLPSLKVIERDVCRD